MKQRCFFTNVYLQHMVDITCSIGPTTLSYEQRRVFKCICQRSRSWDAWPLGKFLLSVCLVTLASHFTTLCFSFSICKKRDTHVSLESFDKLLAFGILQTNSVSGPVLSAPNKGTKHFLNDYIVQPVILNFTKMQKTGIPVFLLYPEGGTNNLFLSSEGKSKPN